MSEFSSLKIVGGLLSSDLLGRVFAGDSAVPGASPESYGLERGESVRRQASRSWPYLLETWQDEKKRDRWVRILLRELGFPHDMPEHIAFRSVGWEIDLDHRTPNREARAPQSVMQQKLNEDDSRLWGLLTNGTTLRLLRDSTTLVGSQYVEFDLRAIFEGELFSDFVLLFLTCHASRWDGDPCYLEQWRSFAADQGERALEQLRKGVEQAISILGTGFISHASNPQLRLQLENSELRLDDLNRSLLRVVYRMLFWFVAEDRSALLVPSADRQARKRYETYFSAARLRRLARTQRGTRHTDLWDAVGLVFEGLGKEGGTPELGLPGIGGIYETGALDEPVTGARLSNEALLSAIRALSLVKGRDGGAMRRVDFGNLGAEELGSIYESLLELIPHYDPDERMYTLTVLAGNERKESGSYYTPSSLVECLLDSALDPLLDEACARGTAEEKVKALLDLTVCDPACGSGHFLVAAARRIAKRIAALETEEAEPSEPAIRAALRRVVGRCIYGVDVNPMAAELAKVSLWLEALEPGKPLTYLDQNIRVGNSLLGVTPALLAEGLPDEAFKAIEGDDKKVVTALKKQNAAERAGQGDLFSPSGIPVSNSLLAKRADTIVHTLPESLEDLHIHQQREAEQLAASSERRIQKLLADAWCAAFVQPKTEETRATAITQAVIESFASDDRSLDLAAAEDLVADLTRQYRFFHWHVEFPHIFRTGGSSPQGWDGGFSCVVGNPPWEKVELKEQEFFAQRDPNIANAPNAAARKKLIAALPETDPAMYAEFTNELRKSAGWTHLLKETGRYPLTGQGRLNTYAVFAETARTAIGPRGRSGLVLPTGIATDATTAPFFGDLVRNAKLVSFLDFENEAFLLSKAVHHSVRFCLLTVCGRAARVELADFAFSTRYMRDLPERRFQMPPEEILLVNPNTGTTPVFRSRRDAEITIGIYKRVPVLWREDPDENPWGLSFMQGIFNMASDSGLFRTNGEGDVLPLYEAKMVHHFDHRLGTYEGQTEAQANMGALPRLTVEQRDDPYFTVQPRYWVDRAEVDARLAKRGWDKKWLLGWRDIARSTDQRTMICSALPRVGIGHTYPLLLSTSPRLGCLYANLASFALDYVVRQKIAGTHLTYGYVTQLPVLPPSAYDDQWVRKFINSRVLELTYTAWDMEPFARDLGDNGPPFRWDEERRFVMRAELDALFFHLYGINRDDVDYIMETFPIVRRKDIQQSGTYRTKDLVLQIYDAMKDAWHTADQYHSLMAPFPGDSARHLTALSRWNRTGRTAKIALKHTISGTYCTHQTKIGSYRMPNLIRFSIEGLLGQFNHSFEFPAEWDFIIIHGPNGIGKTKLLELINAAFSGDFLRIGSIPFNSASLIFDNGSELKIYREYDPAPSLGTKGDTKVVTAADSLVYEISGPGDFFEKFPAPKIEPREFRRVLSVMEHELPITQVGPDTWLDQVNGTTLSLSELLSKYGAELSARTGITLPGAIQEESPLKEFTHDLMAFFIETQRLLSQRKSRRERYYDERLKERTRSTVLELADDLKNKLREALAQNSRTSQQLDRDFPRRIMTSGSFPDATDNSIQEKYNDQSLLRQRLAEVALIDLKTDLPLPQRTLHEWEKRVLWTYLDDTEKKLKTFIPILDRVTLLAEIVNARFLFKTLKIDAERGFLFTTESGAEISPQVLSSGEQHELVLAYRLLFEASEGSLVLIDEPEISLHVAWQRKFLDDITRIAEVSSLRFIIATHSPQIINKWWSRAIALHPYGDDEESNDV